MTEQAFSDPSMEAAYAFRSIMGALACPGRVRSFKPAVTPPLPLLPAAAAIALTMCDFQSPLWLSPSLQVLSVVNYLRFHTGTTITGNAGNAAFAFATASDPLLPFDQFCQGTHEYPDRSTTLVIQVEGFSHAPAVELSGPGFERPAMFGAEGMGPDFWVAMFENHARFPLGIDVIFAGPDAIAACPRSTTIRLLETV